MPAAPVNRYLIRCLDGCGRLTGVYPTLAQAEARRAQHHSYASQATHTVTITPIAEPR